MIGRFLGKFLTVWFFLLDTDLQEYSFLNLEVLDCFLSDVLKSDICSRQRSVCLVVFCIMLAHS